MDLKPDSTFVSQNSTLSTHMKQLERKITYYQKQVEELEYSLKVLIETGTIIPQQLDRQITRVLSGQSLLDFDEENSDITFSVCCKSVIPLYFKKEEYC